MGKKVKELTSNPLQGRAEDPHCTVCEPRQKGRVTHNQVWTYSLRTGEQPLRDEVRA